ncbi:MAG: DNA starvation/stationary phase protection protein [Rickettsiales bacterium]
MSQNLGIKQDDIKKISEKLSKVLANEYFLYLKTLNVHWNVTGSNFFGFHKLLDEQYNWLKDVIDEVAERIRTLGVLAPANYKKYSQDSIINEGDNKDDFEGMLEDLCHGHEKMISLLREAIEEMDGTRDFGSEDMLIKLLSEHEKNLWMLNAHFERK